MQTKDFLQRVLHSEGWYCLLALKPKQNRRVQQFYESINELIDAAREFDSSGYDTYFALATFKENNSRRVDNVARIQSFFLDLDCGPSKDFVDQEEALTALRGFYKELHLPKPLVISSGRGIHVYWCLEESVILEDWYPVAERLKQLCAEHKFAADPAVTSDAARVLRIVRTHNHKTDPPTQVLQFGVDVPPLVNFDKFSELLGAGSVALPNKLKLQPDTALMQKLMGNNDTKFKNILEKVKDGGCRQIELLTLHQDTCSEPMWRAGLSIAKFCSDADKAIHHISKKHPDYSPEKTVEKVNLIKGPYLCTKFDEYNPDICPHCPNWHKVRSPISLGTEVVEAEEADNVVEAPVANRPNSQLQVYTIPQYPKPYFRGTNGGVYVRTSGPDGTVDEKLIYHNDFYVVKRIVDSEIGESIVLRLHLPRDGVREFTVPLTSVTSREELRKAVSMHGIVIDKPDELMRYTATWVNELQTTTMADEAHRQFGWTSKDMKSFVIGDREIFADRTEFNPASSATAALFPHMVPKGSLEGWKEMINFYNRDGFELHQYVIGTSFGSVLMEMLPIHCSMMHLHSGGTGFGKTTVMEAGLSVWGDPEELLLYEKDTHSIKMHRGEVYHNLPMYMDELTQMQKDPDAVSDLAYQIVSGKQRRRMVGSANAERVTGLSWNLIAVSSGNASLVEIVRGAKETPEAEAQRILEVKVRQMFSGSQSKAETDAFSYQIKQNYGFAGEIFVRYVMQNLEEIREFLLAVQQKIDMDAGLSAKNRFWSAGAACTMTALHICNKIGLLQYDTKLIYRWIVKVLVQNRDMADDMITSAEQILNSYIYENWNNILQIRSTDDLRKQRDTGVDSLIVPDKDPRIQLVARYETDVNKLYLLPKPLRQWCAKQQINYSSLIQEFMEQLGGKKDKVRLGKGTHMKLKSQDVIVVDFSADTPPEYEEDEEKSRRIEDG